MKIAYLVFAYRNPRLIKRVIDRLGCDDAAFFVHIDRKYDLSRFELLRGPNVFFTNKRIPVYWGEFSGVEAILILIREALAAAQHYDYFLLLSGSEYPLRSREYIHHFFEKNRGLEFITLKKMPASGKLSSRFNRLRYPTSQPLRRFLFRALGKAGLAQRDYRKHLGNLEPYSGFTWWTLSREACQYIVNFVEHDKALAGFLRHSFAPEESFFHTIIGNSPFRARARRNLVYEDWSALGGHPEIINAQHCALFESQDQVSIEDIHGPGEMLFARKFSDDDLHLIERVEEMIRKKDYPYAGDLEDARG